MRLCPRIGARAQQIDQAATVLMTQTRFGCRAYQRAVNAAIHARNAVDDAALGDCNLAARELRRAKHALQAAKQLHRLGPRWARGGYR